MDENLTNSHSSNVLEMVGTIFDSKRGKKSEQNSLSIKIYYLCNFSYYLNMMYFH